MPTNGVPFQEAIEQFRRKVNIPSKAWDDMLGQPHAKGFAVAGATKMALLGDLHQAMDDGLEKGTSLSQFRRDFDKIVTSHGWQYKGTRAWRTRVIFDTNRKSSYAAGRWEQYQRAKQTRPYLVYQTAGDSRVREEHEKWDDLVLPVDDPFWDTHYPPNDYGCRCTTRSASESDLRRAGLSVSTPPDIEMEPRVNTTTGEVYPDTPKGIGTGWGYNVGKAWLGPDNSLGQHILRLPPQDLTAVLQQNKPYLNELQRVFPAWAKPLKEGYASGKAHPVGLLDAEVLSEVLATDQPLKSATIFIDDWRLKRMGRSSKQSKGINLPEWITGNIPKALQAADAILLEQAAEARNIKTSILYIIKLDDERAAKLVVDLDYSSKSGYLGNGVSSGGIVPIKALRNQGVYKLLKGAL
ncbi:minor capsid protein [Shewanella algae]|uniref:phage head morphogenesis protein n=1 Tax=Shewanella algae TaxID=38313 RepID=UPI001AAD5A50|nr:phage minor head protein [Shewanella algae]MBO2656171.1 minor capsid protein [Shewanella algae]